MIIPGNVHLRDTDDTSSKKTESITSQAEILEDRRSIVKNL